MAVGLLVLAGWVLDVSFLKGPLPGLVQMKANTAIGLLALGGGLLLTISGPSAGRRRATRVLVGLAILIGALALAEYLLGRNLGIDELLFRDVSPVHTVHPGRLAAQTAIVFICLGFALLFLNHAAGTTRRLVGVLIGLSFLIALFAVIGYGYRVSRLAGVPSLTPIALHTAVTLLMLCAGIAAADPRGVFVEVLTSEGPGSVVARRLLPTCIVLFPIFGWVELQGERQGLYPQTTGLALFVLLSTVVLALAVLSLAKRLNRVELERRAAAARERRLGALVDASNEAIASADADGVITTWNRASEELYGYTEAEIVGQPVSALSPPEKGAEQRQLLQAVARGEATGEFDTQRLHKDGSLLDVSVTVSRIMEAGSQIGSCAVTHDIRQRVRALRFSEERYRLLFEHNPQPMLAYDRQTLQIVAVSNAMVANYGYSREEFLTMTIHDLVPPGDIDALLAYVAANPNGVRPGPVLEGMDHPARHQHKDGTIIDIEVASDNLDLDGRECRIVLYHDVTERNKAVAQLAVARDQAVEASNMKSAFLANMSHEIRTPMNGVIGMNELLLDSELTDEQREYAEQVTRSGEQMLAIINDILDIAKIETGHLELDITDFDLHETIKETCSAAGAPARAKGLRLAIQISSAVPRRVRGDGRRFQQILLNLVSNAVKFTSAGAITVGVSATPTSHDAAVVHVEVADTGIGIDPATLQHMFEPFTQADVSTTRRYGGTGLGLAIARELVELMGGTISADSKPGHGSTFRFELELAAPLAEEALRAHTREPLATTPAHWPGAPLVLVAEDSQINQVVAARAVERCGYRVHLVGNGREALQALQTQHYDAVLMDCQMPNMDGYESTAELRRLEHGTQHTPVIAMTAHAMDGDRQRCLGAGMDDHISKPMRHTDLADTLRRWIPTRTDTDARPGITPSLTVRVP